MKVFIWGTGLAAEAVSLALKRDVDLIGYIDNDEEKQGREYFGKHIFHPNILMSENFDVVIIGAYKRYREISRQMEGMGIEASKIIQFFNYTKLMPLAFFYNEQYISAREYQDIFENYVAVRMGSA